MLKSFIVAATALFSITASAQSVKPSDFLASLKGAWAGAGTVVIALPGPKGRSYPMKATLTISSPSNDVWNLDTLLGGYPGNHTLTRLSYTASGNALRVSTTQFAAVDQVKVITTNEFSDSFSHQDPANGAVVLTERTIRLVNSKTIQIVSKIYQNKRLVQSFDYKLQRK